MPTDLSILVFVARPLDYARYRHTALFFDFAQSQSHTQTQQLAKNQPAAPDLTASHKNGTGNTNADSPPSPEIKSSIMEITGSPGFFCFAESVNTDIPTSSNLARVIRVSSIQNAPPPALRLITSETPIPIDIPEEMDWNSQNWVGDALGRLVRAGYLGAGDRDRALDEMVDVVLEARDEETS
ncbi:hypothetical protein N7533_000900 [Penicillium manginii]|uniref:uncharacterized protein n=1 Tax=Penicillium manginii TaxID=203109 RepID=UPI0025494562|nr:uncharacterized protein N7533_000900 [Penicillium manginii]KAJ5768317.1 hypothetical protein N7533_000900 [Penicillium manginii]